MTIHIDRRRLIAGAAASLVGVTLGGRAAMASSWWDALGSAEALTRTAQRGLLAGAKLAPEFPESSLSPTFRANGSTDPREAAYKKLVQGHFADWRLEVGGLVDTPLRLSLNDLRALPSRTQITRHDCVEGWSCIGKWSGVPAGEVLKRAGLKSSAKFIVFYCADAFEQTLDGSGQYYESVDLVDAFHPQTLLAYDMNNAALTVPHGAPLRLRVERQLGYKMAKYLMKIEAVTGFEKIGGGNGGFWEDRGYQWYGGI